MAVTGVSSLARSPVGCRFRHRLAFRQGVGAIVLLVFALLLGTASVAAKPQRIVSMNVCTDQMALELADRDQILSLSYLVAKPDVSMAAPGVAGFLLNHGRSEEILPLEPDLIIAGRYTSRPTVFLLQRLGYNLVELDISRSVADIRDRYRQLAAALGADQRAETVLHEFDTRLASLASHSDAARPTALYLQPNGYTAGTHTLIGDIIEKAGFENLGAGFGITGHGRLSMETVLAANPDVIITDEGKPLAPALAYESLKHPAIAKLIAQSHQVIVPRRYWICGIPETIRAIEILAEARRQVTGECSDDS